MPKVNLLDVEKVARDLLDIVASAAEDAMKNGKVFDGDLDETLTEEDVELMREFCANPPGRN